jgi:hypothetical protein
MAATGFPIAMWWKELPRRTRRDLLIYDAGCSYFGYWSDFSRMIAVGKCASTYREVRCAFRRSFATRRTPPSRRSKPVDRLKTYSIALARSSIKGAFRDAPLIASATVSGLT